MTLSARELYRLVPLRDTAALPEEERAAAGKLRDLCNNLVSFAENFEAAVALFQAIRVRPKPPGFMGADPWLFVPARDGAMTLYQIGYTLDAIKAAFKDCPNVREATDHASIREQRKRFRDTFPLFEQLRHSVGHAAELMANRKDNALKEPLVTRAMALSAGTMVTNGIENSTFRQTINGRAVGYDMTEESVGAVVEVVGLTLAAIKPSAR